MTRAQLDEVLAPLSKAVSEILVPQASGNHPPHWDTTEAFATALRGRLKNFQGVTKISLLLQMVDELLGQSFDDDDAAKLRAWHSRWYMGGGDNAAISAGEIESIYVKSLTAVWLGLYFLGVPVSLSWERVRQWEDEKGGGLPSGSCVAKSIGDIVRAARKRCERKPPTERGPLIIMSGWPIIIFSDLIVDAPAAGKGEDYASTLGRYYELLQLMLYCRNDYPIHYFVTEEVIARKLYIRTAVGSDRDAKREIWRQSCQWLRRCVFSDDVSTGQAVYVIDEPKTPPCFINHVEGLFTFEQFKGARMTELPMAAGYMREIRRALYVQTYEGEIPPEIWRNVLAADDSDNSLFNLIWNRYNCQPD